MSSFSSKIIRIIACTGLLIGTVGCTTPVGGSPDYDPLEPLNRGLYQVHYVVDGVILKPVTQIYRGVVPDRGQRMVHNFVSNIASPITFANSILQGDPENALATLWRFLLNSTIGVAGLFDVATEIGLMNRDTDFGQTLALYGVESGPYLFLPVLGPSSIRDGVGRVGDAFTHPAMYMSHDKTANTIWITTAIDTRSQKYDLLEDIYRSSLDPYATLRSGYIQRRANDNRKAYIAREKAWERMSNNK